MTTPTITPPVFEPDVIVAGDNVQWIRVFDDYDPVNYTMSYALMPVTGTRITITAGNYGDNKTFYVNLPGATTEAWTPSPQGQPYLWQAYMTDVSGNRTTLYSGRMVIKPDFSTVAVADYRSTIMITLQNLYAVVQGKATSDQQSYTIRGRSLSRMQPKELLEWIDFYEELLGRELRAESNAQGKNNKGTIRVRFNDPTGLPVPAYIWMRGQW